MTHVVTILLIHRPPLPALTPHMPLIRAMVTQANREGGGWFRSPLVVRPEGGRCRGIYAAYFNAIAFPAFPLFLEQLLIFFGMVSVSFGGQRGWGCCTGRILLAFPAYFNAISRHFLEQFHIFCTLAKKNRSFLSLENQGAKTLPPSHTGRRLTDKFLCAIQMLKRGHLQGGGGGITDVPPPSG